jgi:hypothetical protein
MIGGEGAGVEAKKPQLLGFNPNPIFLFPIILPTNHFARSLLFSSFPCPHSPVLRHASEPNGSSGKTRFRTCVVQIAHRGLWPQPNSKFKTQMSNNLQKRAAGNRRKKQEFGHV